MAKSKFIEALEEQYTKKDAKSVLRYKAPDNKWRYVQTSKDASGGNMPSGGGITEVTWQELKEKRDNGQLIAGSLYRITDYNCTTTQENTQSAGHQFDIVLLALSENKLAEEGWAMEHPTDVYDVTFSDGVTKRCYLYFRYEEEGVMVYNVVDINTHLGTNLYYLPNDTEESSIIPDEKNKTATSSYHSDDLDIPNLPYNYFQNSNLSAWKVWYCLDNDTSRFAWADDSVDEDIDAFITFTDKGTSCKAVRHPEDDASHFYAWRVVEGAGTGNNRFTNSLTPDVGDTIYDANGDPLNFTVSSFTPAHEGTGLPNGRGIIYRLIDEWGNDCPYDFKNIIIILGGKIGEAYLFSDYQVDAGDVSLTGRVSDVIVKKTMNQNEYTQVIDMGIVFVGSLMTLRGTIIGSGTLSELVAAQYGSNLLVGYTIYASQ